MYDRFKLFALLALVVSCKSAPPEEPAECKLPESDSAELVKCCKLNVVLDEMADSVGECMKLVKGKPEKGPPVPEGFDCMDTCVFSKLGFAANNKLDAEKLTKKFSELFKGDWSALSDSTLKKCLPMAEGAKGSCASGADVFKFCIVRELYMNCPASSWTKSDLCKANVERLEKCPHSMPFLPGTGIKKN
uniref:Odorant binding protein 6 n=1 Tax=Apolygus lucorum TaxID=248454 RepID=F5B515_APOLU|nr:odorant binding protein 6 [Apolygus lucorum]